MARRQQHSTDRLSPGQTIAATSATAAAAFEVLSIATATSTAAVPSVAEMSTAAPKLAAVQAE